MRRLLVVMLLFLTVGLLQAYKKNVLIENFTATWCGYCPYQAQAITQLEEMYGESLVVIKYHPSSSDPFYHSSSVTRQSFYNVPGYPTSLVSGNKAVIGGWSGVITPLNTYVIQSFNEITPCSISVSITDFNSSTLTCNAKVKVFMTSNTSIPIPPSLKLRVAILEDSIFYTWQSMNVLRYVVRNMLPSASGTSISLGYGDSVEYNFSFSVPSLGRAPYYYAAAFVQSDSIYTIRDYDNQYSLNAGKVIQSGKGRVQVDFGNVIAIFDGIEDENGNRRLERNESGTANISFTSVEPFSDASNVNISVISLDPDLTVSNGSYSFSIIPAGDTVSVQVDLQASNFSSPHMSSLQVSYSWDGSFNEVDTFRFKLGVDSVLIWDGSFDANLTNYVRPYVNSLGFVYEWQSEADSGKPFLYDDYRHILYIAGQTYPDISVFSWLKSAIDEGKNIIISGQNIAERAETVDPEFLSDYLHIELIETNTADRKLKGTGIVFTINDSCLFGGSGAYNNQTSKDVIRANYAEGVIYPILNYRSLTDTQDQDSIAGVYLETTSGSRVIFLSFGVEGVGSTGNYITKTTFMSRLFQGIITSISEPQIDNLATNNIVRSGTFLSLEKGFVGDVFLYTADGRLVKTLKADDGNIKLDNTLKPGIYFLFYNNRGNSNRQKLVILQ
ncbi:MAG TPA: T9SS type A sorting domain-containing protein [Candidatus Hydrothermia bacterium]|nr:T9SS type A sorting domain-containing protein [Candidatus Hydrothermia bacterium]